MCSPADRDRFARRARTYRDLANRGAEMASQWTRAARHDRMTEIRSQLRDMDNEAGGDQFDEASRDTWNTLNAELDEHREALDEIRVREERLAEGAANP